MRSEVQIFPDPPDFRVLPDPRRLHSRLCGAPAIEQHTKIWTRIGMWLSASAADKAESILAQDFFRLRHFQFLGGRECTNGYMTDRKETESVLDGKKTSQGAIAQLGERLPCTQEVGGSIPPGSTIFRWFARKSSNENRCMIFL